MGVEVGVCIVVLALALWSWHPLGVLAAWIVLATRQHALFILYHDGVHGLVARPRRLNDAIVNAFVGVPQLVPVHLFRSLHLVHHQELGTERDPERVLLYKGQPWRYVPLAMAPLVRQLAGDLLLWNNVGTLVLYGIERWQGSPALNLPRSPAWVETWAMIALWIAFWGGLIAWDPVTAGRLALLWFVPLLTLTQLIQKVRSFAEHAGDGAPDLTYSWEPGPIGRLVLWPYHIGLHREHHAQPHLPWFLLPSALPLGERRRGASLGALLWSGSWR